MKPYRGPPMTLESAAAAKLVLMVWCKSCGHRSEPDPADQARWYGPETPVPEWRRRLICSQCGSRDVNMGVTGRGGVGHAPTTRYEPLRRGRYARRRQSRPGATCAPYLRAISTSKANGI